MPPRSAGPAGGQEAELTLRQVWDPDRRRVVVQVEGVLDVASAPELAVLLQAVPAEQVVVDVGGVQVLCTAGLNVLAVA